MPVTIKSAREIELMKEAGRILEIVHDELGKALHPGMTTLDIDRLGEEIIRSYGCEPSFLNYNGYPASICVSVNDEVVHGIPSAKRVLKERLPFRCGKNPWNRRDQQRGKGLDPSDKRMFL